MKSDLQIRSFCDLLSDSTIFLILLWLTFSSVKLEAAPRSYQVEELKKQGYVDDRQERTFGSFSNTLMAIGPGALIHGIGHWQMGDQKGAWQLLGAEIAGIVALSTVSLTQKYLQPTSNYAKMGISSLSHIGWGLTLGSWVLDVIGSYQGELSFNTEPPKERLNHISIGYRYLEDQSESLRHHIIVRHALKKKRFKLATEFNLESQGKLFGIKQNLSFRLTSATPSPKFELNLGIQGRRWQWLDRDTTQLALIPYLSWSWPLKGLAHGLGHTLIFQTIGYGWEGYQSPQAEVYAQGGDPSQLSLSDQLTATTYHDHGVMTLETGLKLKLFQSVNLAISYLEDPTVDVRQKYWGSSIWGLSDLQLIHNEGLWRIEILIRQSRSIDLMVETLLGTTWSSWLTVRYVIGGQDS